MFQTIKMWFQYGGNIHLGVVVGRGQVWMENNKVKTVKEWKTPTKIKEVESFL